MIDIPKAVKKFKTGLEYNVVKNKYDPNIAQIDAKIGKVFIGLLGEKSTY